VAQVFGTLKLIYDARELRAAMAAAGPHPQ
jgi:hypothetical protein